MQNYMIEDIDFIDKETGSNGARKKELIMKYIEIWKTDAEAFTKRKANSNALRAILFRINSAKLPQLNELSIH